MAGKKLKGLRHYLVFLQPDPDATRGPQESVDPDVLGPLRPLVDALVSEPRPQPVPGFAAYQVTMRQAGAALLRVTLVNGGQADVLVSIGVATPDGEMARLWTLLHDIAQAAQQITPTNPHQAPPPWCAVFCYAALTEHPDALE